MLPWPTQRWKRLQVQAVNETQIVSKLTSIPPSTHTNLAQPKTKGRHVSLHKAARIDRFGSEPSAYRPWLRYPSTAHDPATDVEHYLADEPVCAYPIPRITNKNDIDFADIQYTDFHPRTSLTG